MSASIRSNNIYISAQLYRWLKWLAEMETPGEEMESFKATPDAIAEKVMRDYILEKYPDIQQLESEYWTARKKLDTDTVDKLRKQNEQAPRPAGDS